MISGELGCFVILVPACTFAAVGGSPSAGTAAVRVNSKLSVHHDGAFLRPLVSACKTEHVSALMIHSQSPLPAPSFDIISNV